MTKPLSPKPPPSFDPRATYPHDYQQGVDTAERIIAEGGRYRTDRISYALARVTRHMETWPVTQGKNGLTDRQWARSAGFAHTLRELVESQGS